MRRFDLVVVLLLCIAAGVYYFARSPRGTSDGGPWAAGSLPKESFEVKVHPSMSFSGKTKAEILKLREEQLAGDPKLGGLLPSKRPTPTPAPDNSEVGPSSLYPGILSSVNDGNPWRGLLGELNEGRADEGDASASISLLNPLLLCGIRYAVDNTEVPLSNDAVKGDLLPAQMTFDGPQRRLLVTYRLQPTSPLLQLKNQLRSEQILIYLENCNAGDLGLPYFAVNSKGTSGVRYVQSEDSKAKNSRLGFDKILPCNQYYATLKNRNELYIKTGSFMTMSIQNFPVKIQIDFWRQWRKEFTDKCDFQEIITIEAAH